MVERTKNEGEGSRTAARNYNKATAEFVASGKVEPAAKAARKAMETQEGKSLLDAESKGKVKARK